MAHTKPPFACSRFVVIASIMWRITAHMTVVGLEVSVHIHRNAVLTISAASRPGSTQPH